MGFFSKLFGPNIENLRAQGQVEELIKALEDRRPRIQIAAAMALGEIEGPRALASLVHSLRLSTEESKDFRPVALEAVRSIGDIEGLLKILDAGDPDDREGAVFALGRLGDLRAIEPLISVLGDAQADRTLRGMAALSLAELDDLRAVEPLISALGDLEDVGGIAASALGRLRDPQGLGPVIAYFIDRIRSLDMKGFHPNRMVVDMLVDRPQFRIVAEAISAFGAAATCPLREALDQEVDEKVRLAIQNVLWRAEAEGPAVTLWAEDEQTAHRLMTDGEFSIKAVPATEVAFLAAVAAGEGKKISSRIRPNPTRGGFDVTLQFGGEPLEAKRALAERPEQSVAAATNRVDTAKSTETKVLLAEQRELAHLLKEQTGDPAFLHRTDWVIAYGKKDFKTALEEVTQALQIVPNDPLYLALRAMTHYSVKNYTDAQSDLKAALQSNPAQKEALNIREAMKADAVQCRDRARELSKKKESQRALDELNRAVELEPDNPLNFFFRGLTYGQVENYDAAINDVTHTLQLDPQHPDGQEILQSLKNMAREKGTTKESSEQSFFFICTGNASLTNAYNDLFQVGVRAYNGTAGHYYASVGNLDVREQEASKVLLPFVGQSYMGSKSTPVLHMHEVLQTLRVVASREIHIAFVSVDQTGVLWVQKIYSELLSQAVSQGILPYKMCVTKDKDAAQFLLDSLEKNS